jgi:prolipoprotein diacylglyceryltransferase
MFTHGIFRFFHEFLRATPPIIGPFSGYQFAALSVAALGAAGFVLRRQPRSTNPATQP